MRNGLMRRLAAMAAFLGVCVLTAGGADWPQYRGDAARAGYSPEELPGNLAPAWSFRLPQPPMPAWPDPGYERHRMPFDFANHLVAAGGRVYFGDSAGCMVHCLDLATGRHLWSFPTGGPVRFAPAIWKDRVLAVSDDGHLYCLASADGRVLWKFYGGLADQNILGNGRIVNRWPARGGPVVHEGTVYFSAGIFPTQGAFVWALEIETGSPIWVNDTACLEYQNLAPSGESLTGVAGQGYLVIDGDRLLVPTGRGQPGVFDRKDGRLLHFLPNSAFRAGGSWVMAFDELYLCADKVYVGRTGAMLCPNVGNLDYGRGAPAGSDGRYMAREAALTPRWLLVADGKQLRLAPRDKAFTGPIGPRPPTDGNLPAPMIAQMKSIVFDAAAAVPCEGAVIAAGKTAYVGGNGVVSAVDLDARKVVWSAKVDGVAYSLAAVDGRLLAATSTGAVYCFAAFVSGTAPAPDLPARKAFADGNAAYAAAAQEILRQLGTDEGYCLDLGCGDGRLAYELATRSKLYIYAVESDPKQFEAAREAMIAAGLYGHRVMVHRVESLEKTAAPNYFADLVVSGRSVREGAAAAPSDEALRAARPFGGLVLLGPAGALARTVRGPLEGAGMWTHQYGDAGNTCNSRDALARAPLGVLWFDSPGQGGMPHGWGRPPAPLAVDDRLLAMGVDFVRCTSLYNGRVLWETPLKGVGAPYRDPHYGGTYLVGANWCANSHSVFAHDATRCVRINLADGKILATYQTPPVEGVRSARWGYVGCTEDTLLATADCEPFMVKAGGFTANKRTQGLALFAIDLASGKVRWVYKARANILRDTIAAGGGRVFFVDRPAQPAGQSGGELVALNIADGTVAWRTEQDVFGNMLAVSEAHDVLLMAMPAPPGSPIRALDEDTGGDRMIAWRAGTGEKLWDQPHRHALRPVLTDRLIVTQGADYWTMKRQNQFSPDAFDLLSGATRTRAHPVTGATEPWTFGNLQRCGVVSCGERLMLYRTSDVTYYDLQRDEGAGNFGGMRPGCWINVIPAGGLVLAPDNWSGCYCAQLHRTSVALEPVQVNESWGILHARKLPAGTVGHIGLNFGALGDRRDADGVLWLATPRPYSRSVHWFPKAMEFNDAVQINGTRAYRRHADRVTVDGDDRPWLLASGLQGAGTVAVDVSRMPPGTTYTLRLLFAELDGLEAGQRVLDVKVNGQTVLAGLDVAAAAGGPGKALVKELQVQAQGRLTVELVARTGQPILSAMEIRPQR